MPSLPPLRLAGLLAIAAISLFVVAAPVLVLADKGDLNSLTPKSTTEAPLSVTLGKAELINLPGDISDVLVADPSVVDVQALQSNRLYVVGLNVGDTNLIAVDGQGNVIKRIDIHVHYDMQAIQALVNELFPNEKNIKVGSIHGQILLSGKVSTPDVAAKVASLIGSYVSDLQDGGNQPADSLISNMLEVDGEQQVTLQVKIVEARRNLVKELGIETNLNSTAGVTSGDTGFGLRPSTGTALNNAAVGVLQVFQVTGIDEIRDINLFINALEDENLAQVLAEPNLTAVSGEEAGFLAGGETPIPSGLDQLGNIVIEFRQFGVSLNFRPIVMSDDRISLQMSTEVSSINFDNALPAGDIQVPGFDVRRASTTVELPSGRSIMIAGLLQSSAAKGLNAIPGIKNTPVLGDLISSRSFQRDETELVVIITPYIVKPYKETERAVVHRGGNNHLAKIFARTMRKHYAIKDEDIFDDDERYGYILE
ncbi:MAG: type II and III secretion system protein family protein [Alphaproteobacteria bacterium]